MTPTEQRERNENLTAVIACAAVAAFLALVLVLWFYGSKRGANVAVRVADTAGITEALTGIQLVNINTASADELEKLPGIGEKKAAAIVEYREAHGAFSAIKDVMNVPGIGAGIFEQIKDNITV
ncbi:MAG: helix-hairpin-helix domain-containing protein [Clostridia bacterium]|nr:helix-hairpin-helix domain-containing protein [Clostridia bacterium]